MTILATSIQVTINDTSLPKILCSVTPNLLRVNEGQKITYTVLTTNVSDYTTLYWNTSGTRTAQGFDDDTTSGSVVIVAGVGYIERPIKANFAEDGTTTMDMWISTDQANTSIIATTYMPAQFNISYFIVAGGGGGGWGAGGGGGAGGILNGTVDVSLDKSYPISVGAVGSGINYFTNSKPGINSEAFSLIATGGGGGGVNTAGGSGGSGGGAGQIDKDLVLWVDGGLTASYDITNNAYTWYDLTTYRTNFTFYGGDPEYSTSIGGGSLLFTGSKYALNSKSLYNSSTTNLYSIYLWVYPITAGQLVSMNGGYNFDEDGVGYWVGYHYTPIEIDSTGTIKFNQWNGTVGLKVVGQSVSTFNNWYNLVITYDGNQAVAYKNGVLVNTLTNATAGAPWQAPGAETYLSLMLKDSTSTGTIAYPTGRVASFRGYSRALSAIEVKDFYNAQCERFNLTKIV